METLENCQNWFSDIIIGERLAYIKAGTHEGACC